MSFKENLLNKMKINRLARKVLESFGPPQSGNKIDKDAMRSLLEMSPYRYHRERDLDLYIEGENGEKSDILVLDNELPIYRTTIEDVAIRKSPYTKEMLSIGNIIKILKDSDVKISRKAASLEAVQKACIDRLDLSYSTSDIDLLAKEGVEYLDAEYADGILENLSLFAELLEFQPPPNAFRIRHHEMFGVLSGQQGNDISYGPVVVLSLGDNTLRLIKKKTSSQDKQQLQSFQQAARGKQEPDLEGPDVFHYLKDAVLK
jgi:hypothetical protein